MVISEEVAQGRLFLKTLEIVHEGVIPAEATADEVIPDQTPLYG